MDFESLRDIGPVGYYRQAALLAKKLRPDWIIGLSDIYYGITAVKLGQRYHISSAIDAYDNFESYIPWLKPLHHLWRKALFYADVVTAAGPQLANYMKKYRPGKLVSVVPMAADPIGFVPLSKNKSRRAIGLPPNQKIIGYCGSISKNRGIEVAFEAYEIVRQCRSNVSMVLSGRKDKSLQIPSHIRWLGYLPDRLMPSLLNAMNVLLVINRLSAFGQYSYPVKLYEAMDCHTPVVSTSTGATRWILSNNEPHLANAEDPLDLTKKIVGLLDVNKVNYGNCNNWNKSSDLFEEALSHASDPRWRKG